MILDLKKLKLRLVNEKLQNIDRKKNKRDFIISNPEGNHAICAGLTENIDVTIKGHVGYYCAGMNQNANIIVCLLYTSPSPRDLAQSRMPSSA